MTIGKRFHTGLEEMKILPLCMRRHLEYGRLRSVKNCIYEAGPAAGMRGRFKILFTFTGGIVLLAENNRRNFVIREYE